MCKNCGTFEELSKEPLKVCPKCKAKLKRKYGKSLLQFKGKGFYKTDYVKNVSEI